MRFLVSEAPLYFDAFDELLFTFLSGGSEESGAEDAQRGGTRTDTRRRSSRTCQSGIKLTFSIALMCTTCRRVPARVSTDQGSRKKDDLILLRGLMALEQTPAAGCQLRNLPSTRWSFAKSNPHMNPSIFSLYQSNHVGELVFHRYPKFGISELQFCFEMFPTFDFVLRTRKVDVRLPGNGNSKSHSARPVHRIISMMKWIRTGRLSMMNSLSVLRRQRS